jgi:hypothetical protein
MNCPQCQTVNGPDAAFCANCGTRLAPVMAAGQTSAPGTPPGYGAPGSQAGYGTQGGYGAPGGPAGYGAPAGSDAPPGYVPPAPGYGPPASGYGAPGAQPPAGYPQGQYQPGQSGPRVQRSSSMPPVNFDLNRLTTVDKVVGVATLITMISLWLPWFSASYSALGITSSGSISGTGVHGWLWLEFIVALVLLAYLAAKAAWDPLPFRLPITHELLLTGGTGLQFLLILIGFFAVPSTGGVQGVSVSWDFGAILALIASIAAAGPVIYPAVRSYLDRRNATSGAQRY